MSNNTADSNIAPTTDATVQQQSDAIVPNPTDLTTSQLAGVAKRRKLIVCIDGTSNQFSDKNTNVVELYSRIAKGPSQLTYYNSGVGTYAKPPRHSFAYYKQMLSSVADLAIASHIEKVILGAYRWLSDNYHLDDQIFLFGESTYFWFSRGAYQVRALAAMIDTIGLLWPGNQEQIPFAWELYATNNQNVKKFKETFCREKVDLHFLGVWDTVSSVGFVTGTLLPKTDQCDYVTHFRHALALDECRVKFLPEYMKGAAKVGGTKKEVWFAGTHSDIGGGNKLNRDLNRGGEPLRWMMEEARLAGLSVVLHDIKVGVPSADVTQSLGGAWWLLEYLPIKRRSYEGTTGNHKAKRSPHLGRGREIISDQRIHWTVKASLDSSPNPSLDNKALSYSPKAGWIQEGMRSEWDIKLANSRWEGGDELIQALELAKQSRNRQNQAAWISDISNYVKKQARPEIMWIYGGPLLLNELVSKNIDYQTAKEIVRAVLGLKTYTKTNRILGPGPIGEAAGNPLEKELDAVHIKANVLPRIWIILRQWVAPYIGPNSQQNQGNNRFRSLFDTFGRQKKSLDQPTSAAEDPYWGLRNTPSDKRYVQLPRITTEIVLDLMKVERVRSAFLEDLLSEERSSPASNVKFQYEDQIYRKLSAVIELLLGLLPEKIDADDNEADKRAALAENVAQLIEKLAMNEIALTHLTQGRTAQRLLQLLGQPDVRENKPSLAIELAHTLARLVSDPLCATEIISNKQHLPLINYVNIQSDENDKPQSQMFVNEVLSVIAHMRGSGPDFQEVLTSDLYERVVLLLKRRKHPATRNALIIIEAVSIHRPYIIYLGSQNLTETLCDSIRIHPEASLILANLTRDENVEEVLFETKNQDAIKGVLGSKDSDLIKATLILVTAIAGQEKYRGRLEIDDISEAIVAPLESRVDEVVQCALDAAIQLSLHFDQLHASFASCLKGLTFGGRNDKAVLALAGTIRRENDYHESLEGPLFSVLVRMMEDEDNVLAEGAIQVLSRFMKDEYGIRDMYYLDGVQVLGEVLDLALDPIAYMHPHSYDSRIRITSGAFQMVKFLAGSELTKRDILSYDIIDKVVLLTDSPRTYEMDREAAQLLKDLETDEQLATQIKLSIEKHNRSTNPAVQSVQLFILKSSDQEIPDEPSSS